jgi:tetratricopeptide (TPR) repeat protein
LGACGRTEQAARTPEALARQAERLAGDGRDVEAADLYRRAFALLDPRPEEAAARSALALARAQSLAASGRPLDALAWLRWSERLDPTRRRVFYERARILDGTSPATVDPEGAAEAYRRYLDAYEAAGSPAAEQPSAAFARMRLRALEDR